MLTLLPSISKPSHYTGNEPGAVLKNPQGITLHIALAFPDTYSVGMSYLGQKILYDIANSRPHWYAERVMAPEKEVCDLMRARKVPLSTLESRTPLARLAAVCFSVTHEMCFTDVLNMLDLASIPLRARERPDDLASYPLVMAGGGAMLGAEPLVPFIDLVSLGDGEEQFPEILELLEKARCEGWGRQKFLREARHIPGVYIPAFFEPDNSTGLMPKYTDHVPTRRIVSDLNKAAYPVRQVTPIGAVHDRMSLEIARGCTRGCRFCHAGMVYRPVRERSPEQTAQLLEKCLASTGFDEVSFLALSAGDCTALKTIYKNAFPLCQKEQTTLALPSLRVGSIDDEIMEMMASIRRAGATLAPEAGSQRLRDVINKGISEQELLGHCAKLLEHGWRQVKLYFMIGLPSETDEDILAIAELSQKVRNVGGKGAPRMQVTVAVSPFVPKPFTPFQWEAQLAPGEIERRIGLLRSALKSKKGISLKWHSPETAYLEGILSRGDRRLADVIEKAFHKGAIFCSWAEHFDIAPWLSAMRECGLTSEEYTGAREPGQPLPWSHINAGISESFLLRERKKALDGAITEDCRFGACHNCGACDTGLNRSLVAGDHPIGHKLVFSRRDQNTHAPAFDQNGLLVLREYKNEPPRPDPKLTRKASLLRLWHFKTGSQAFLSHLELQAVLIKSFRRARLPLAFSQGFHPLPLLSFGRALPVGIESQAEWFSIWLHTHLAPVKVMNQLNQFLPEDLKIFRGEITSQKSELSITENYRIDLPDRETMLQAAGMFANFTQSGSFYLTRKTKRGDKEEDIRPYLLNWHVQGDTEGTYSIVMTADWTNGYVSPALLAHAILGDLELSKIKIIKTGQSFLSGAAYGDSA